MDWDLNAYHVGALPAQFVHSYTRLDTQISWRVSEMARMESRRTEPSLRSPFGG